MINQLSGLDLPMIYHLYQSITWSNTITNFLKEQKSRLDPFGLNSSIKKTNAMIFTSPAKKANQLNQKKTIFLNNQNLSDLIA